MLAVLPALGPGLDLDQTFSESHNISHLALGPSSRLRSAKRGTGGPCQGASGGHCRRAIGLPGSSRPGYTAIGTS